MNRRSSDPPAAAGAARLQSRSESLGLRAGSPSVRLNSVSACGGCFLAFFVADALRRERALPADYEEIVRRLPGAERLSWGMFGVMLVGALLLSATPGPC